jgi:hypothetical protein
MSRVQRPRRPAHKRTGYALTAPRARQALADDVKAAAELASPGLPAAELIEFWRGFLHRIVDDSADAEALRHPSANRLILRVPRYAELYQALKARGAR